MPKISGLIPAQTIADDDELPIRDISAQSTRRMTLAAFRQWLQSLAAWIGSSMIDWSNMPPIRSDIGYMSRGNVVLDFAGIADNNWRYFRNDANTADMSMTINTSGADLYIEVSTVIWSNSNAYKNVRVVLDGSAVGDILPMSYLSSGVAPGALTTKLTGIAAGEHTIKLQWQREGGVSTQVSYRNVIVKAYELL